MSDIRVKSELLIFLYDHLVHTLKENSGKDYLLELKEYINQNPLDKWRPEVVNFANLMEHRLSIHDYKNIDWSELTKKHLFKRLSVKRKKLKRAIKQKDKKETNKMAADCANYAMMLAEIVNNE